MTHEKNMIDYLDWIKGVFLDKQTTLDKIYEKGDFNKSQPKLGDYVPTNEKGEVMEKPRDEDGEPGKKMQYQSALDRVIWKGWEYTISNRLFKDNYYIHFLEDYCQHYYSGESGKSKTSYTYEQLINSGVKLERIQRK